MSAALLAACTSRPARWLFATLAIGLAVWAVARDRAQVAEALGRLDAGTLLAAAVATVASIAAAAQIWWVALDDLGDRLTRWDASRIFLVAQLGKYVPGSLWEVAVQAEMARDRGVPRGRAVVAGVVMMLVQVGSGAAVALATVALLPDLPGALPAAAALVVLPLVLLHRRVLGRVAGRALAAVGAEPLAAHPSLAGTARGLGWGVLSWLAGGVQLWVVARALGAEPGVRTLAVCAGAYAVAWVVGAAVFVVPAGAGAREVTLAAALAGVLGPGEALVVALLSRVLFTVGDLAGIVLGVGARAALREARDLP